MRLSEIAILLGIPASASLLAVWADATIRRRRTSLGPAGPDAHSASPAGPSPTHRHPGDGR